MLVSEKLADEAPGTPAVTLYAPATVFAVNDADAVARPEVFVDAVVVAVPFAKTPDAPVAGAVNVGALNVTVTPGTGFPYWSATFATRAVPNADDTVADCPEPADTVTALALPGTFVRE